MVLLSTLCSDHPKTIVFTPSHVTSMTGKSWPCSHALTKIPRPPFFVFLAWLMYAPPGGLFIPSYCGKCWHRQAIIILKLLDRNMCFSMVGTESCATWTPSAYQKLMSAIKPSTALEPLSPLQLLPWGPFMKRHFKHMWSEQMNN